MKPVDQTKLHDPDNGIRGNCMAASLASILELPLSDIPEFEDMEGDWWPNLMNWLESLGFYIIQWREEVCLQGYYLCAGMSERGVNHQVVYKNGKLVHDPHPSKTGIKKVNEVWALLPIDPSKFKVTP